MYGSSVKRTEHLFIRNIYIGTYLYIYETRRLLSIYMEIIEFEFYYFTIGRKKNHGI